MRQLKNRSKGSSKALAVARAAALCAGLSLTSCSSEEQVCRETSGAVARYDANGEYAYCCWPGESTLPPDCCGTGCAVSGPFVPPRAQARRRRRR